MATTGPSNQFRITTELAAELEQAVSVAGHGKWANVYSEVQDDGRGLYMSVDLADQISAEVLDTYKAEIMALLGPRLPARIEGKWSWAVGIRQNGKIVDSVDSINFVYDENVNGKGG